MSEMKNLVMAMVAALIILLGWQYFYEAPKEKARKQQSSVSSVTTSLPIKTQQVTQAYLTTDKALGFDPRVKIETDTISGSILLRGARIDDLVLNHYKETDRENSRAIRLLSPSLTSEAYFAEFGWISKNNDIKVPDSKTLWNVSKTTINTNDQLTLSWNNSEGVLFKINIYINKDYLFTVTQSVENLLNKPIYLQTYGLINRNYNQKNKMFISHEGAIGSFNKRLKEVTYEDLEKKRRIELISNSSGGWLGISDKYWLVALVPDQSSNFDSALSGTKFQITNKYQVDYLTPEKEIKPKSISVNTNYFFAGAKVLNILDRINDELKLDLFDRAIDFGWFYFITKPMFYALKYCYDLVGNFGLSILIITILVKLLLYPLASKSFNSMSKMKKIQPQVTALREKYADDKMKQNQAIMDLYKKEKVNPAAGCLPMLIQIPIFFSLYKVLFITIEMHHAKFFGWIKDLSAPDPTSIFNLFGLINWTPPSFLIIGAWPLIMAITMYLQQKFNPEPSDPVQAQMMKFLPLIFLFMFASFPSGLVIYWAWSNILSILQQYFIMRKSNSVKA